MDYSNLTPQEKYSAAQYHGFVVHGTLTPTNINDLLATINVTPGAAIAVELIDLYIATSLTQQGIQIPPELNMETITLGYYAQLAPVLYLPTDFTPENLTRAKRIIRIIRNIQAKGKAPVLVTMTTQPKITIMPLTFYTPYVKGDFNWMIKQPEYADVLFLFNDNWEQFYRFHIWRQSPPGTQKDVLACSAGGGNAIIRPYQCLNPPRAAGIPTGDKMGGFQSLKESQPKIDMSINYIRELLKSGRYSRVAYSAAEDGRTLGTGIFNVAPEIKGYIVRQIESLV